MYKGRDVFQPAFWPRDMRELVDTWAARSGFDSPFNLNRAREIEEREAELAEEELERLADRGAEEDDAWQEEEADARGVTLKKDAVEQCAVPPEPERTGEQGLREHLRVYAPEGTAEKVRGMEQEREEFYQNGAEPADLDSLLAQLRVLHMATLPGGLNLVPSAACFSSRIRKKRLLRLRQRYADRCARAMLAEPSPSPLAVAWGPELGREFPAKEMVRAARRCNDFETARRIFDTSEHMHEEGSISTEHADQIARSMDKLRVPAPLPHRSFADGSYPSRSGKSVYGFQTRFTVEFAKQQHPRLRVVTDDIMRLR